MNYYSEPDGQLTLLEQMSSENAFDFTKKRTVSKSMSELIAIPYLYLDLSPNHVDLFGNHYWELRSPYQDGKLSLNTGPAPREPIRSSLPEILEEDPAKKYYLSQTACLGILRRAEERGKALPPQLQSALRAQAGLEDPSHTSREKDAYHIEKLDKRSNLDCKITGEGYSCALVAGFSAGAGASAGSIGYSETVVPTLKGAASGNCMPSVLCLNDQGGHIMDCTEDVSGTLRAQEHGHQPLVFDAHGQDTRYRGPVKCSPTLSANLLNHPLVVNPSETPQIFENHGIDARYTGPHPIVPTLSARAGTGGNNLPLVSQEMSETICIMGPAIDQESYNDNNRNGYQEDIPYTLMATDYHSIFSRQRVDKFTPADVASTESTRQHKDATDLVYQSRKEDHPLLIRRLTPLECERLQGFPDGWTDIPCASDSARYKALGNSVAIPCVEFVLLGLVMAIKTE